ncbi:L1 protein [Giraffa camelopardalis papillomavirus 1]|uniref:Major capsid protein L1 n=1 Tax=Giraffa camelopardalis papillomavirus 1 TaxID=1922325 RepID=A0A1L3GV83_9PAPI|nr:L1 protein [Giraffa camelopardalis papillomavirus 1]APG30986.1 L1 protein [Giraffa camelopardalis papillomavirus 1]
MALWSNHQRLYLPPAPVTKVVCTETYINRRNYFYHGETERLLTVGHPFYPVKNKKGQTTPKVSPNQYRVFRVSLPDPNQFALPDKAIHNPDNERLVWGLVGLQVSRGQPLGGAITGSSYLNVFADAENVTRKVNAQSNDNRNQAGVDAKQQQILIVGCTPATGEYWTQARPCVDQAAPDEGECPPLELKNKQIEDADMMDIGFGALDFKTFNKTRSDYPLDIANEICLYPDYLKMTEDPSGDSMFFFSRKEQTYVRHIWSRGGVENEAPDDKLYLKAKGSNGGTPKLSSVMFAAPSGSLVSTDSQLFNRPYWVLRAQGMNNGICWNNELFVTVGDNTRGTNFTISVPKTKAELSEYDATQFNVYHRHTEEYKLAFILQLCSVELKPETVSYLQTFRKDVLQRWEIGVQHAPSTILEDQYRFLESPATKCPSNVEPAQPVDPYHNLRFWDISLKDKLSLDLSQFPLGRRFLVQQGLGCSVKRKAASGTPTSAKKRKRQK